MVRAVLTWLHDHQTELMMVMMFPITICVLTYFVLAQCGNGLEHYIHRGICPGCKKPRGKWDWGDTNQWDGTQKEHYGCRE